DIVRLAAGDEEDQQTHQRAPSASRTTPVTATAAPTPNSEYSSERFRWYWSSRCASKVPPLRSSAVSCCALSSAAAAAPPPPPTSAAPATASTMPATRSGLRRGRGAGGGGGLATTSGGVTWAGAAEGDGSGSAASSRSRSARTCSICGRAGSSGAVSER